MSSLYRFYADFGRMGELEGLFVTTDEQVQKIIGKEIYFGEVLGKHSDVIATMQEKMFTKLTDDEKFISKFIKLGCESGMNPFNCI